MTLKRVVFSAIVLLVVSAVPVAAQESLGDLVVQGGYDWLIGKWVATTDDGDEVVYEQKWALDRHAILVDLRTRDFKFSGIIVFLPWREEVLQFGVDNRDGIWEGAWRGEYGDAILRLQQMLADGEVRRMEMVHTRVDVDAIKMVTYGLSEAGNRAGGPWSTLTYRRQTGPSSENASADPRASTSVQGPLGDLLSRHGYKWLLGRWQGVDDQQRTVWVRYALTLDGHAGLVDVGMGQFAYHGLVMLSPSREEVIQVGADNMAGCWKGTWSESDEGLVNRHEYIRADGTTEKMEHVYVKVNDATLKIKQYAVEADGSRAATPRAELTLGLPSVGIIPD